jgi:hypothetical protein
MDESLLSQIETLLHRLDHLMRDGRRLRDALLIDPTGSRELELVRSWQRECAATIGQLSGGNKAHWLSRAYSNAFLLSVGSGEVATEASVTEIIDRILEVLEQAGASLSQADLKAVAATSLEAPPRTSRFDFVRDSNLRSNLELAFADSRSAYERGDFVRAFVTSCSVLEAIITDALERGRSRLSDYAPRRVPSAAAALGVTPGIEVGSWSFETRMTVAEKAGLISAGCARLPVSARRYRNFLDEQGELRPDIVVSDREARVVIQVLNVIIRDLAPGR